MRNYRGLTIETKRWVYGHYCEIEGQHFIIVEDAEYIWQEDAYRINGMVEVLPATVGQSTGLHDKGGEEDFQGNIWEVEYRGQKHRFLRKITLDWDGYSFDFVCLTGDVSAAHANVNEDGIIIGNVHQPELLEAKDA
jgi:hypothetical protein